jgi:hypothetical protein
MFEPYRPRYSKRMQMPRPVLPSQLTYNDLNGAEATEVLVDWFRQLLKSHPVMQPHLTLPMARFTLDIAVGVDMYIGGSVPVESPPEHMDIAGSVSMDNKVAGSQLTQLREILTPGRQIEHTEQRFSTIVNAAPIPGGQPPDEVRHAHDLPVPRPAYGPRDTGSHMFLADVVDVQPDASGGRRGEVAPGYTFSEQVVSPGAGRPASHALDQHIPVDKGEIHIDLTGDGIVHDSGMRVKERAHVSSVKEAGDERGKPYSSVNGVYDPGPAGLMTRRGSGGLGTDGRSRISFGNSNRG